MSALKSTFCSIEVRKAFLTVFYNLKNIFLEVELESQQERYIQVLRSYLQHTSPHNPGRLGELLAHIPEVKTRNLNL